MNNSQSLTALYKNLSNLSITTLVNNLTTTINNHISGTINTITAATGATGAQILSSGGSTTTNAVINAIAGDASAGMLITIPPPLGGNISISNTFLDQSVKTTSSPTFAAVTAGPVHAGALYIDNPPLTTTTLNCLMRESDGTIKTNANIITSVTAATGATGAQLYSSAGSTGGRILLNAISADTSAGMSINIPPSLGGNIGITNTFLNQSVTTTSAPTFGQVTLGTGLYLPAPGGTPTLLNNFEFFTLSSPTLSGPYSTPISTTVKIQLIGLCVTICGVKTIGTTTSNAAMTLSPAIPSRFRPTEDKQAYFESYVSNARFASVGDLIVSSSTGVITFYVATPAGIWGSGFSNTGPGPWTISYLLNNP